MGSSLGRRRGPLPPPSAPRPMPGQERAEPATAIGAGAFDPDPDQRAERGQPGVQVGEAGRGDRERPAGALTAVASSTAATCTSRWVSTPPVIGRVSTMVMAIPSHFNLVKGWHARPGKETVTIGLRLTDRSITLQTGRCPYPTPRPADTQVVSMPNKSDRTAGAADRNPPPSRAGGPQPSTPPSSLGIRRYQRGCAVRRWTRARPADLARNLARTSKETELRRFMGSPVLQADVGFVLSPENQEELSGLRAVRDAMKRRQPRRLVRITASRGRATAPSGDRPRRRRWCVGSGSRGGRW